MELVYKTLEVLGTLYTDSSIELAVRSSLSNTGSIITYIATILVALTAIALPLTQQSLQWMEDKYDSESLVKYLNQMAPISADLIVPRVLSYMVFGLILYLVGDAIPTAIEVIALFIVVVYFVYIVIMYSRYFSYIFKNLSSTTYMYDKIRCKTQNLSELTSTEVVVLMDIERARLIKKLEISDLSKEAKDLGYSLKNADGVEFVDHMNCYLNGLYKILYGLPRDASQEKYTKIANLLSYLSFQLLGDPRYNLSFENLKEIIVWVESQRNDSYKPLISGRFLCEFHFIKSLSKINVSELINYIRMLVRFAKDEKLPVVTELYTNLCLSMEYKKSDSFDLHYFFHSRLRTNDLYRTNLNQKLETLLVSEKLDVTELTVRSILEDAGVIVDSDVDKLIEEFIYKNWINKYNIMSEKLAYSFLFYFHTNENYLLSLRNTNNPLKSDICNFSNDILPNSIDEIFSSLVNAENLEYVEFWESPKESIIHSCGVLLVYEVVKCLYNKTEPSLTCRSYVYSDLESLIFAVRRLSVIVNNITTISAVSQFISSHYLTVDVVLESTKNILRKIKIELKEYKYELEERGYLDDGVVKNIEQVYFDAVKNNTIIPMLLKKVKLVKDSSFTFRGSFPRATFLRNTNVHTDFSNLGTTVNNYLASQFYLILQKRGTCLVKEFPETNLGIEIVILTSGIKEYLSNNGCVFIGDEIIWPDGSKAHYFVVNCRFFNSFYCATNKDYLFKYQIGKINPFEFELVDQGKQVETNVHFYFKANV